MKALKIIFNLSIVAICAFCIVWVVINFETVKSSLSGTQLYTSAQIEQSYDHGFAAGNVNQSEYETLIGEYRDSIESKTLTINARNETIQLLEAEKVEIESLLLTFEEDNDTLSADKSALQAQIVEIDLQITALNSEITRLNSQKQDLENALLEYENVSIIDNKVYVSDRLLGLENDTVDTLILENNTDSLSSFALRDNENLKYLVIYGDVTTFDFNFSNCPNLEYVFIMITGQTVLSGDLVFSTDFQIPTITQNTFSNCNPNLKYYVKNYIYPGVNLTGTQVKNKFLETNTWINSSNVINYESIPELITLFATVLENA